jgi:predicted MFS family arabinose efflux permease
MRGTALGAYTAFFDLSLGVAGPVAGMVAQYFNYHAIYLMAAASCLLAFLTLQLKQNNR